MLEKALKLFPDISEHHQWCGHHQRNLHLSDLHLEALSLEDDCQTSSKIGKNFGGFQNLLATTTTTTATTSTLEEHRN